MKREQSMKKRIVSAAFAAVLLLSVFTPVLPVQAAAKPYVEKKQTSIMEQNKWGCIYIENFPEGAKVTNVKSSNKKVLTASWHADNATIVELKLKKAGKANVSFNLVNKGKTTKFKTAVTVKKWQNPCASFKAGNTNYVSKFKKQSWYTVSHKGTPKRKVSVKAAKGWKLCQVYYQKGDGKYWTKMKNNSSVKFSVKKKDYMYITAEFQNEKTKEYRTVILSSERK